MIFPDISMARPYFVLLTRWPFLLVVIGDGTCVFDFEEDKTSRAKYCCKSAAAFGLDILTPSYSWYVYMSFQ